MIEDLIAEGYYAINPKIRSVLAFGPIIRNADAKVLKEAHDFIDETQIGMLAEVRYLFHDKNVVHSAFYMPNDGYGTVDVPVSSNGLVHIRKVELLKMPMPIQSQILKFALDGVIEDALIERIESLYRMNVPLSDTYTKLLSNNAIFCNFSEDRGLVVSTTKRKHTVSELIIHMDKWYLQDELDVAASGPEC